MEDIPGHWTINFHDRQINGWLEENLIIFDSIHIALDNSKIYSSFWQQPQSMILPPMYL